jgi:hypothetical protein
MLWKLGDWYGLVFLSAASGVYVGMRPLLPRKLRTPAWAMAAAFGMTGCGSSSRDSPSPGHTQDGGTDSPASKTTALDAGGDTKSEGRGCDPNVPTAVTYAGPIASADVPFFKNAGKDVRTASPAPCGTGFDCTYQDLEIDYLTCAGAVKGSRLRYVRPDPTHVANADAVPVLLEEPGTGDCSVGDPSPSDLAMSAASHGAAVFETAPRGHSDCYFTGDALYQASDWMGPLNLGDDDRLLLAYVQGWVDKAFKGDPRRLGITGGSHGGLTSYFFGRTTHVPGATGYPLALVAPIDGNPDFGSWGAPGFDPNDLTLLLLGKAPNNTPWGSFRLSGEPAQIDVFPGPLFATPLEAAATAQSGLPGVVDDGAERSAHDDVTGTITTTFRKNVAHFFAKMGSQDCIIPHQGNFDFYDQLLAASFPGARLVSPLSYHSCTNTPYGYGPMFSAQTSTAVQNWTTLIQSAWVDRYLIGIAPVSLSTAEKPPPPDPGADDPSAEPEWMFMLADESLGSTPPNVYMAKHPGSHDGLSTSNTTFDLSAIEGKTLSYDPEGMGTSLDLHQPAWNTSGAAEMDLDFAVTEDFVVIGQPTVTLNLGLTRGESFALTAILYDIRPGEPAPWPVGSERRYAHPASGAEVVSQTITLDTIIHRFKAGDTLRLALANLAVIVPTGPYGTSPMFAPSLSDFEVEFHAGGSAKGSSSTLVLPTIPGTALVKAPGAWQIQ